MNPIYAKSIADEKQLNTRHEWFQQKEQLVDSVEVLLLGRDFKDLKATEQTLLEAKKKFGRIALEAPDCIEQGGIDPVSSDAGVRAYSKTFLDAFTKLADAVGADYAQYQYMRGKFGLKTAGKTVSGPEASPEKPYFSREMALEEISRYNKELQDKTKVPLQIENTIPLNPEGHADKPEQVHYEPDLTRIIDFATAKIPLAFDLAHILSTYYTFEAAIWPLGLYHDPSPVDTDIGRFWINITPEDHVTQLEHQTLYKEKDIQTKLIIQDLGMYKPEIGSVQVANAISYGFTGGDHGRLDGWLNLELLVKSLAQMTKAPFIPEVTEDSRENYEHNPVNQRKLLRRMHRWLETA